MKEFSQPKNELNSKYNNQRIEFQQQFMKAIWLILILSQISLSLQQCCATFINLSKKCATCPPGTHLFRNNCLTDHDNCVAYADGFDCSECKSGFAVVNGQCQPSTNLPFPSNDLQFNDQQSQPKDFSDSQLILADYSRSIEPKIQSAQAIRGIVRTFKNGTAHTIIQYKVDSSNYYESIAEFDKNNIFLFKIIQIRKIPEKITQIQPTNSNNISGNRNNIISNTNSSTNPNTNSDVNLINNNNSPLGLQALNFVYLNYDERKKDPGFLAVDKLVRSVNQQELGDKGIVLAAYYQKKGLSIQYIIYYESSNKKSIFENRSIYQLVRKKALITSFYRTNLK